MTPCSLEAAPRFADTHYEAYARGCAEIGIPPHPRTQPKEESLGERYAGLVVRLEWLVTCWAVVAVFFSATAQDPVPWPKELLHRIVRFVATFLQLQPICACLFSLMDGDTLLLQLAGPLVTASYTLRMRATMFPIPRIAANTRSSRFRVQNGPNWG